MSFLDDLFLCGLTKFRWKSAAASHRKVSQPPHRSAAPEQVPVVPTHSGSCLHKPQVQRRSALPEPQFRWINDIQVLESTYGDRQREEKSALPTHRLVLISPEPKTPVLMPFNRFKR